ncbi:hypothetical protein ACFO5R_12280 [Halosolutus amylolyticus]|uniref:Halobacterial output domain-containing protein n=1 Tax=Halosolutus amylolyticus TaxID=2932267 RepID=A0ABD5PRY3_9EURY|nr:hypothetical protein [Halosolutus amylolyticus]
MIRGKEIGLSLLAVGTAAAAGYVLRSGRSRTSSARSKADLGARIVEDVPTGATVVDATSNQLDRIPGARRAIDRAVRNDAREEWEHVTLDRDGAWSVVDAVRSSLPYYDAAGCEYNGVYVRYEDRIVVLDAIGWARLEDPVY